jgi:tRNA-dihydrouridine synthase
MNDCHHTLILAPMRGFTDHIFRTTYGRHFFGLDSAVAPFLPTMTAGRIKSSTLADLLPQNNRLLPVTPQLIGNEPEAFIVLARRLHAMGYPVVNWNLGCPFPMVAKKMRGSGLLPHPGRIEDFLEKTVSRSPARISVKARLGRVRPDEILALMPIFNRFPLEEIIIHPRTGKQMYTGRPDLEMFRQCLQVSRHRIVYNGDIDDPVRFRFLAKSMPSVGHWMIGRGVLSDPFLPGRIKAGREVPRDPVAAFRRFYEDLFDGYRQVLQGPGHLLDRMKGFWKYFSLAFRDGDRIARRIHRSRHLARYREIVAAFWQEACWEPRPGPGPEIPLPPLQNPPRG